MTYPVKIDGIHYKKQPTGYLCGQAVVAMLADVPVEEVVEVMHNDMGTPAPMIKSALYHYGIKTATKSRVKYAAGTVLPDCCILSLKMPGYGHWSLYYKGTYYDPEFGVSDRLPPEAVLCAYWEIIL